MMHDDANQTDRSYLTVMDKSALPRTDELTPKDVLLANLADCPPTAQPVVLYSCGSLCPVHRQHVRMQELAKLHFQEHYPHVVVVGGFLATSNDLYVKSKYQFSRRMASFLPYEQRAHLIRLALSQDTKAADGAGIQHPFIRFDAWDGQEHPHFQDFYRAQASLQKHLDDWCEARGYGRVLVVGVHGADIAGSHMQNFFASNKMGLVCVERSKHPLPAERPADHLYVVRLSPECLDAGQGDISSTAVQKLMRGEVNGHQADALVVSAMLHEAVENSLRALWKLPKPDALDAPGAPDASNDAPAAPGASDAPDASNDAPGASDAPGADVRLVVNEE